MNSEARKLVEDWIAEATEMATKTPASKKGEGYWDGRREGLELALGVIVHYGI